MKSNKDQKTVDVFGDEWQRFDQTKLDERELQHLFDRYFSIFPWDVLPKKASGFDMGCGSGRWAKLIAKKVDKLHCIDPSEALEIAKINLKSSSNCIFHKKEVGEEVLPYNSQDFGIALGVLHHVPNTLDGIKACVKMLKPESPFLIYLYYALDNRPLWFKFIWFLSNCMRLVISRLPYQFRYIVSQIIVVSVYWPLARIARLLEILGISNALIDSLPLSTYRKLSFYTMRTDALDRFGTRLEKRFTKDEVGSMMREAGLERIRFSENIPYWVAVGYKKK